MSKVVPGLDEDARDEDIIRSHFIAIFLFQSNSNSRSSLRPMTYLASDSWPLQQCRVWGSSGGMNLKSDQKGENSGYFKVSVKVLKSSS